MKSFLFCLLSAITASAAGASTCVLSWTDALRLGTDKGYRFQITSENGNGECFRHKTTFVATASTTSHISCHISFFHGAQIKDGWKMRVIGDTSKFNLIRQDKATPPLLRITADSADALAFIPKSIEVVSPTTCANIFEVFAEGGAP